MGVVGEVVEADAVNAMRERLADAACGQGYGQFVLGELAFHEGDFEEARRYLRAFVQRSTGGRVALAAALNGEIARARRLLARIPRKKAGARGFAPAFCGPGSGLTLHTGRARNYNSDTR